MENQIVKDRARVVCVRCHGRKVRCDVQDDHDRRCSNCRRAQTICRIYEGSRRMRKHMRSRFEASNPNRRTIIPQGTHSLTHRISSPIEASSSSHFTPISAEPKSLTQSIPQPVEMVAPRMNQTSPSAPSAQDTAYIADHSILQARPGNRATDFSVVEPSLLPDTPNTLDAVLQVSEADVLPRQPLRGALIDVFFTCLADSFPMIERAEVDSPGASILLQQAVCFAGSLMRQSSLQWSLVETKALYDKVKLLISLHYENNVTLVLKAMCLLTLWSPNSPNAVSLVGPWHATGSALRLAIQMGMHRKSTLLGKSDAKCRLKIIWMLHASDCALSLIYGRPPMLRSEDLDIPVLTNEDYDDPTQGAQVFIADVSLSQIMGKIAALASKGSLSTQQQRQFYDSLKLWIRDLPPALHLLHADGTRMPYHFSSFDLYISYLSTIIILQLLSSGARRRYFCSMTSIIAATRIADLYDEILCRDQAAFLTAVHGFWCTVTAIPLLQYRPESSELETRRAGCFEVMCSIVNNLQEKFGLAFTARRKIAQLKSDRADVFERQALMDDRPSSPRRIGLNAEELAHLEGLFPSLYQWCPELETMAASIGVVNLENPTTPDPSSSNINPGLDEPGSILDELGGTPAFMDTLFDNNFFLGDMTFEVQ